MESSRRDDVHVFTGPSVPQIFEDAYAVNTAGTLRILRWSTRHAAKAHPVAEFAPGCWMFYRHMGGQGDEAFVPQPPKAPEPKPAAEDRTVTGPDDGDPFAREEQIRSREPGAPQNLRPAQVRPPIPPADFAVPVSRLPKRLPASDVTEVLPAVRDKEPEAIPQEQRSSRRRPRIRRPVPGAGEAWSLSLALAAGVLTAFLR